MTAILALLVDPAVVPAVVAPVSAWTPATVGVLVGGATTLIGAVAGAAVKIIREIRVTKTTVENNAKVGAAAGASRDTKLDRIEVLVDGRYSQVLAELATVRAMLAERTGDPLDQAQAVLAQSHADDQHARVVAANPDAPPDSGSLTITGGRLTVKKD